MILAVPALLNVYALLMIVAALGAVATLTCAVRAARRSEPVPACHGRED